VGRSHWLRGLRCRSAAARLLRLWVRIPPGAWMYVCMYVCYACCVVSGRGLCDELITRPEESHRLWCVVVWSRRNLVNEEGLVHWGAVAPKKNKLVRSHWPPSQLEKYNFSGDRKNHWPGRCNRTKRITTLLPSRGHFRKQTCDAIPLGRYGHMHTYRGHNPKWAFLELWHRSSRRAMFFSLISSSSAWWCFVEPKYVALDAKY
jgi:hypothetical protein